jgi:DNA-binding transcriptional ArsR family regulator
VVASSLSTYLDVTRAANGAAPDAPRPESVDVDSTAQAAKVLAALHEGKHGLSELRDRTELGDSEILAALGSLAQMGLVELDDSRGRIRARLTSAAEAALKSA